MAEIDITRDFWSMLDASTFAVGMERISGRASRLLARLLIVFGQSGRALAWSMLSVS